MRQNHLILLQSRRQVEDFLTNPAMVSVVGIYVDRERESYYTFQRADIQELFDDLEWRANPTYTTRLTFEQVVNLNKPTPI